MKEGEGEGTYGKIGAEPFDPSWAFGRREYETGKDGEALTDRIEHSERYGALGL